MSVSKKVLRKMKKVVGVIGVMPVLTTCSSQISHAKIGVSVSYDRAGTTVFFSGEGEIGRDWPSMLKVSKLVTDRYKLELDEGSKLELDEGKLEPSALDVMRLDLDEIDRVVIGPDITKIGDSAFRGLRSLKKVSFLGLVSFTNIGSRAFAGCSSLEEIVFPYSVMEIGEAAFEGCRNLENIILPGSLSTIGACAFRCCKSLKNVVIPEHVREINKGTFENCGSLESVALPRSIEKIGTYAFRGCKALKSIILPSHVRYILPYAFSGCEKLVWVDTGLFDKNFPKNTTARATVVSAYAFDKCFVKQGTLSKILGNDRIFTIVGDGFRLGSTACQKLLKFRKQEKVKLCYYCLACIGEGDKFFTHRRGVNFNDCHEYVCCEECQSAFLDGEDVSLLDRCPYCGLTNEDRYLRRKI